MQKVKSTIKSLSWLLLFAFSQFLLFFLFFLFFKNQNLNTWKMQLPYLKEETLLFRWNQYNISPFFQEDFSNFINDHLIYSLFFNLLFLFFLWKIYKKKRTKEKSLSLKNTSLILLESILISFLLNNMLPISNSNFSFHILLCISTSIIGPIIEEILFRGLIYKELQNAYAKKVSICLMTVLFAIFHGSGIKVMYAFFMGILFIYYFETYKTLKAPIIGHIAANLFIYLFYPFYMSLQTSIKIFMILIALFLLGFLLYKNRFTKRKL